MIRAAVRADAAAVAGIDSQSFADSWSADYFRDETGNPVARLLVAQDGAEISGFLLFWSLPPEAELLRMAVAPRRRRRGTGIELVRRMLTMAAGEGVRRIFLEVRRSNTAARRLYASMGFKESGIRRGYYRSPREDAVCLEWRCVNADRNPDHP